MASCRVLICTFAEHSRVVAESTATGDESVSATSAQKLAHEIEIVLPKKPSEGFPRSPMRENTRLQIS